MNTKKIIILLAAIAAFAIGSFAYYEIKDWLTGTPAQESIAQSHLQPVNIGDSGLSLKIPGGKLRNMQVNWPAQAKANYSELAFYKYSSGSFMVGVAFSRFKDGLVVDEKRALYGSIHGAVNGLRKSKGLSKLHYVINKIKISNLNGYSCSGSFMKPNNTRLIGRFLPLQKVGFKIVVVIKDKKLWVIQTHYKFNNPKLAQTALAIIDSVRMENHNK